MSGIVIMTLQAQADGEDAPTVLEISPRTVLSWEKNNRGRSAALLGDDAVMLTYLYELAWIALGKPGDDFGAFCSRTDVSFAPAKPGAASATDADPTRSGQSTASS